MSLNMNKKYIILTLAIFLIAGIIILAKKNAQSLHDTNNKKLQVVASFYPMYFFASQIAGNKANVVSLTPAAAEPHDYEPTTQDIATIENANLLVLNGGALEAWGDKIRDDLQGKQTKIVIAGDSLVTKHLIEKGKTIRDPHVWLDPILAKQEVVTIEKGFEAIDPVDKMYFQNNAKNLQARLDQINSD